MSSRLPREEALEKEDRIDEMKKQTKQNKTKNKQTKNKQTNSPPVPHPLQAQQTPASPYSKVAK